MRQLRKTTELPHEPRESRKTQDGSAPLRSQPDADHLQLKVGRHTVSIAHIDKVYWPRENITKGDLIRYYGAVGPTMISYLKGRPAILNRFPNGIDKPGFVQQNTTKGPSFTRSIILQNAEGRELNYFVYTDVASLIYVVNLGTIDQHAWLSRIDALDKPDYVVFDLDPKEAPFANVLRLALLMRAEIERQQVRVFVKTSGSTGIHLFVPIARRHDFGRTSEWAAAISETVAKANPDIATTERRLAKRGKSQVYIDWQQNARGKSIATAYSVRARPGAPVSTPVTWLEVERGFQISDFTMKVVLDRLETQGDLWLDLLRAKQNLPRPGSR